MPENMIDVNAQMAVAVRTYDGDIPYSENIPLMGLFKKQTQKYFLIHTQYRPHNIHGDDRRAKSGIDIEIHIYLKKVLIAHLGMTIHCKY